MAYLLKAPRSLQYYAGVTEGAYALNKREASLPSGSVVRVERAKFGYFDRRDVVVVEIFQQSLAIIGARRDPAKFILVEELGLNTSNLVEIYRAYVGSKGEASQKMLSTGWTRLAHDIGTHLVLSPQERRTFESRDAPAIFNRDNPIKLEFPA